jgi:hypothetical protein
MGEKLRPFQTVALVEVSGQFHAVVALLSWEWTPLHRSFAETNESNIMDAGKKLKSLPL